MPTVHSLPMYGPVCPDVVFDFMIGAHVQPPCRPFFVTMMVPLFPWMRKTGLIHFFVAGMINRAKLTVQSLGIGLPDGLLWISYPTAGKDA